MTRSIVFLMSKPEELQALARYIYELTQLGAQYTITQNCLSVFVTVTGF